MEIGQIALWAGAGAMMFGTLMYLWLGRNVAIYKDRFFTMTMAITVIASTAYLAMALGIGRITLNGEEVFIARYADWVLTTPLIVALLGIIANASRETIAALIGLDIYMIVTGALAVISEPLWQTLIWWTLSTVAFVALLYLLLGTLSKGASEQPDDVVGVYKTLRNLTVVVWSLYPIIWIVGGQGFGIIPPNVELISFVALDVTAKVVFGFVLLRSHETVRIQSFYGSRRQRETDVPTPAGETSADGGREG